MPRDHTRLTDNMCSIDIISDNHVHVTVDAVSLSVTDGRIAEYEMETLSDGRQVRRWIQMGCGHFSETSACSLAERDVLSVSNDETTICATCALCGFRAFHNIERRTVDAQGIAHLCCKEALMNRLLDRPHCFRNARGVKQGPCCSMFTLKLVFVWFVCTAAVVGSMTAIACSSMQCSKIRPAVVAFSILFLLGMFSLIAAILCIKDNSAVEMIDGTTSQHHVPLDRRVAGNRRDHYREIMEDTTLNVHTEEACVAADVGRSEAGIAADVGRREAGIAADEEAGATDDVVLEEVDVNETLGEIPPSYESLINDHGIRPRYSVVVNGGAA